MTVRIVVPVFACFIAFTVCSVLGSGFRVRFAGALCLAAMFAMVDWDTWKAGAMRTNFGVIIRSERPLKFACTAILFLMGELVMVVAALVHAIEALN